MPASVGQLRIPSRVTGTVSGPERYGRSASQNYYNLAEQVKDEFMRSGHEESLKQESLKQLDRLSIRYTPKGSISKNRITDDAVENALGYAHESIAQFDLDRDNALNKYEIAGMLMQPFLLRINQLQRVAANPEASKEKQEHARLEQVKWKRDGDYELSVKAPNFFAAVDIPDADGQSDDKLTADELAAKTLFDDGVLAIFKEHKASYPTLITTQAEVNQDPSRNLQNLISAVHRKSHSQSMMRNGEITAAKREMSDLLVQAPVPTNKIISDIHKQLGLKARAAAQ